MPSYAPLIPLEELPTWRDSLPPSLRLVLTNGCFDILHPGHVLYLEQARALGDFLLVALNSDISVQSLKGPSRPINSELDRYTVLSRLRSVDAVTIFPTQRATPVILAARPSLYAKGGDYTPDSLHPEETAALRQVGASIHILPLVQGKSTTNTLLKILST